MIKLHEIYYIAGLLEGEGYFGYSGGPNIQMTSTDLDTMEKFKSITKATNSIRITKSLNPNYKDIYNLNLCASLAVQWMMTIYTEMSSRRKEQIRKTLAQWKQMPNNSGYCRNGHILSGVNAILQSNGHMKCYICSYTSRKIRENRISY